MDGKTFRIYPMGIPELQDHLIRINKKPWHKSGLNV